MGGATVGIKSYGGSVIYKTCLIFCQPTATSRKSTTDSVNISPNPQKMYCYQQDGSMSSCPNMTLAVEQDIKS